MINPEKTPVLVEVGNKIIRFPCRNCKGHIEYEITPRGSIITDSITPFDNKKGIIGCWKCGTKYKLQEENFDEFVERRHRSFFDFLFRRDKDLEEHYKT